MTVQIGDDPVNRAFLHYIRTDDRFVHLIDNSTFDRYLLRIAAGCKKQCDEQQTDTSLPRESFFFIHILAVLGFISVP